MSAAWQFNGVSPWVALGLFICSSSVPTRAQSPAVDSLNPGADRAVECIAIQADGKVLVGGGFTVLGGQSHTNLGRLMPTGIVDASFNPQVGRHGPYGPEVVCLAVQEDGGILVGGSFETLNGQSRTNLGRLNPDGTLDTTFDPGANSTVECLTLQADGKILLGGWFTVLGGQKLSGLGRLNADGTVDLGFNPGVDGTVYSLAVQPDGKIVRGGQNLARLNPDGTLDPTFGIPGLGGWVWSLALQTDGKILVGGWFNGLAEQSRTNMARLNPDGSLDLGFDPEPDGEVYSLAIQADGEILVGGGFTLLAGQGRNHLGRLNSEGTLDPAFTAESDFWVESLALQSDGRILVGGWFYELCGAGRTHVGRLTAPGAATQTLTYDGYTLNWARGGTSPEVWRMTFEASPEAGTWFPLGDGTRVAGGWQLPIPALPSDIPVRARGYTVGAVNNGSSWFVETVIGPLQVISQPASVTNNAGTATGFSVYAGGGGPLGYQWIEDGNILTDGGNVSGTLTANLTLSRVWGSNAGAFSVVITNSSGSVTSSVATLTVVDPFVSAQPSSLTNNAGSVASFNVSAVGSSPIYYQWRKDSSNLSNGAKISGATSGALTISNVLRSDAGSYCTVVSNSFGCSTSAVVTLTVIDPVITGQPVSQARSPGASATFVVSAAGTGPLLYQWRKDGVFRAGANQRNLILTGLQPADAGWYDVLVSNVWGSVTSTAAELSVNLAVADSFDPGLDGAVVALAIQADGKVVIGGSFTTVAGQSRNRLARLNLDGTLELGFNPSPDGPVNALVVQPDGKILVGGNFYSLGGASKSFIGRLRGDGTLDSGFSPTADSPVDCLALQPDGKVLVGGHFSRLAGQSCNHIGRLNPDGTLDTGFNSSADAYVSCLAVQADGKILAAGYFSTLGGQNQSYLGRLNPDGTLDQSFNPVVDSYAYCLALQADGKIVVGGNFLTLNSQSRSCIGRLNPDGTLDLDFNPGASNRVYSLAIQADGEILLGGAFNALAGQSRSYLARLNADGTLDHNFNPGAGGQVNALALEADGQLVVVGTFTTLAGQPRGQIGRLNNLPLAEQFLSFDGSRLAWIRGDTSPELWWCSFDYSSNGGGLWTSLGPPSRIPGGWHMIGLSLPTNTVFRARGYTSGGFNNASGWYVESVLRPPLLISDLVLSADSRIGFQASGPFGATAVIEGSPDLNTWTSLQTNTLGALPVPFVDPAPALGGSRFYRLRSMP